MWFQIVFFSVRPIVLSLARSTMFSSTTLSSSSRKDHFARPFGGGEHIKAIGFASAVPRRRCAGSARHAGYTVISLAAGTKVFLACRPVDLRNGFDGLAAKAQQVIGADPQALEIITALAAEDKQMTAQWLHSPHGRAKNTATIVTRASS